MSQKAEDLAAKMSQKEFVATDGLFHCWRKQKNVILKQTHGKQKSADVTAVDQWIEKEWLELIASYAPKDAYNADESGLYYRTMPSHFFFSRVKVQKAIKFQRSA
ncbi:hypothetical protein AVEN_222188-1 [Araneus ventricosus]|uniref:Uncharacterized protein n=1 Tax=Araneus ventricosus TaxID=182803 RepID=A0A4Y2XB29_ARAVE|nr:hypothetical protein AVEN_222188-1 [Araneus ventricosus]